MNKGGLPFIVCLAILCCISCRKERSCDSCSLNKQPIAVAGPDQVINLPTDTLLLDGGGSSDPDGTINEWKWTHLSGPAGFLLENAASSKAVVKHLVAGVYQFQLMVIDNGGSSAKDTITVTVVNFPNQAPVVHAGQDQKIMLPLNSVLLNGSGSTDADHNISGYKWSKIAGPSSFSIINASAMQTEVTNLTEGVYQFELKVTDLGGLFGNDTLQVTVNPDLTATIQWQKALGGTRTDIAQAIQATADGGYILAGNTNSPDGDVTGYHIGIFGCYQTCSNQTICDYLPDGLVIKLGSSGNIQWERVLGGSAADNLLSIQPTPDGGYITSGITYSNDGDVRGYHGGDEADAWLVKLSSSGAIQWQKVLGGSTGCDFANVVLSTPDGGYIVAGHTDSHDGNVSSTAGERDVWIVKLSTNGDIQWQKTIGGALSEYAYAIQLTADGGYILAGYTYSNNGDVSGNHGDADAWIVKISSTGAIQWQKALGGRREEIARSVQVTPDGGYIVAGSTKSNDGDVSGNHGDADAWVLKLSSTGNIEWQKTLGGSGEEIARSVQVTPDGGYIVTGSAMSNNGDVVGNHGGQDAWVVKLSNDGTIQWQKSFGGYGNEFANSIQLSPDGGFIVAGQTNSINGDVSSNHGVTDCWVIKLK
jgi:hypothetical protein